MRGNRWYAVVVGAAVLVACNEEGTNPIVPSFKPATSSNGTTLAGYKTLDVCEVRTEPNGDVGSGIVKFSGEIAVWNSGGIDTEGLAITDVLERKGNGNSWINIATIPITVVDQIAAGTTQATATIFPYSYETLNPGAGPYRNTANITITNHSGQLGKAFGPSPKASWLTGVPLCPKVDELGCSYTQGYWGNKPGVVWPGDYDRNAAFFQSAQTWQTVMDTPVNVSQGYYQLAHQYIAAVLNVASGAFLPEGVKNTLAAAGTWLAVNGPSACTANGSCGLQKDWAAVLDDYNKGIYPGGPPHCGDEGEVGEP